MATLESIDEVLATHQPALPSTRLSMVEQTLDTLVTRPCDRSYSWPI